MDYIRSYKSFISSHYLNEGLRMTAGILLPAFIMLYFDMLPIGVTISLGALFVSITDNPGPIQHRTTGMLICNAIIFVVGIVSGLVNTSPLLLGVTLLISCFIFSMLSVYGKRAGAIGLAALIVIVLDIGQTREGGDIFEYAFLLTSGGLWYMSFSMVLNQFRPYKLIQQALGEWIESIADFLQLRSGFYAKGADYVAISRKLLLQQADVQEKQQVVNELIFKTQRVVKDSTHTGRILVMMYLDGVELFEKIMTSYQSYSSLHEQFDETNILEEFRSLLANLSSELHELGITIKLGNTSKKNQKIALQINNVYERFNELRKTYLKPSNITAFITLQSILDNIKDIAQRIEILHEYTAYDKTIKLRKRHQVDYNTFITHEPVTPNMFIDNLSFKSDIFRHSIRLATAVMVGYIISLLFTIGYSYWILLTILVILKPAYSLTKQRNSDRLFGTITGVFIGVIILLTIDNTTALLFIMIAFMIGYFSTMRTNYFISVMLMTPYVVLFFHLLYPGDFTTLLKDRIIDTAIGSTIAFIAMFVILPTWEREKIKSFMVDLLKADANYFTTISTAFVEEKMLARNEINKARQEALVALANVSDAFKRMLSEPKHQQKGIENIHKFVVLNHMFTSYIATISAQLQGNRTVFNTEHLQSVNQLIKMQLLSAALTLENGEEGKTTLLANPFEELEIETERLLQKRKEELEKGELETSTKAELFNTKSIVDQFSLVYKTATKLKKVSTAIATEN